MLKRLPDELEPIVVIRSFPNHRESYPEVSEFFRHLFNLYEDRTTGTLYLVEEDGSETEVVKVDTNRVSVRTRLLHRYLAARQKVLVVGLDSRIWFDPPSGKTLPEPSGLSRI